VAAVAPPSEWNPLPGAPAAILTHGLGNCKNPPAILTLVGVLNRAGYHVLLLDVRDAGNST
jgi:predicted alpha/beta-fold hydrolase